mgnify:CR=1 FL=1
MSATIIISLITALAAVLSPNIAEIIRSRNERQIKMMELVYPHKRDSYETFIGTYAVWLEVPHDAGRWRAVCTAAESVILNSNSKTSAAIKAFLASDDSAREVQFQKALECLSQELQP